MSKLIIAGTGHRPEKLGGYGDKSFGLLCDFAADCLNIFKPDVVISGMALGWDQALAIAALRLDIKLVAAVPFVGQESRWPESSQQQYQSILAKTSSIKIVCDGGYAAWKLQQRNMWMVDNCNHLLALWDSSNGGTANCVKYAYVKERAVLNLWNDWSYFQATK